LTSINIYTIQDQRARHGAVDDAVDVQVAPRLARQLFPVDTDDEDDPRPLDDDPRPLDDDDQRPIEGDIGDGAAADHAADVPYGRDRDVNRQSTAG
jgi:hypothetical protein